MLRIGVDVGGTNTDAVLMDGNRVLADTKSPTTPDVSSGIINAIRTILNTADVDPAKVKAVMIGTTHFTNAFVEGKQLLEVGVLRIGLPAGTSIPPMIDWPTHLLHALGSQCYQVRGGFQYDGRENAALDEDAVRAAAKDMHKKGLNAIAISGIFSPVNAQHEERAAEIVSEEIPQARITLSSRIGRIGMLERENAAIMNASLAELASHVVQSFLVALGALRIDAPFYISQNDGTLMNAEFVEQYPVLTFASGPTNSMRGAAFLSGVKNALVVDIGGTTTDIGVLVNGFPRESSLTVDIGGVRTNFRMPDVFSIGLGGGSLVRNEGGVTVGPDSVGYRLLDEGLVFGGKTLTASDIAVAAGQVEMGDPSRVSGLDPELVQNAIETIRKTVEDNLDRMKTSAEPVPLVLVGGGAVLLKGEIAGISEVITPPHAGVANAIGAAIAQVGGETDRVFLYEDIGRDTAIEQATAEARAKAISAGGVEDSIEVVNIEELPLQYVPGGAVRLKVRVVGDLAFKEDR